MAVGYAAGKFRGWRGRPGAWRAVDAYRGVPDPRPAGGLEPTTGRSRSAAAKQRRCSRCCCCTQRGRLARPADRRALGRAPPATAAKALQVYVSQLRKLLGDGALVTRGRPATCCGSTRTSSTCDRFERLVAEARGAEPAHGGGALREALALWRGPPLAELAYEPFAQREIGAAGGAAAGGARGADRGRPRARPPRRARRRARGARRRAPAARAAARAADARALPLRPPGRGARGLPRRAARRSSTSSGSSPGARCASSSGDPAAGPRARPAPRRTRRPASRAASSSGRERELAELVAGLEDAFAGRGRLFLVAGEPGIGKSRLAEELAARAHARGARVLVGRCWEAGGAPAYWPGCRRCAPTCARPTPRRWLPSSGPAPRSSPRSSPSCASASPGLPPPSPLEPEGARFRLFDATAEFLRNAGRGTPARARARRPPRGRRAVAAAAALPRPRARLEPPARARRVPRRRPASRTAAGPDARRGRPRAASPRLALQRAERVRGRRSISS